MHASILISNNSVFDYHSNGMERPITFTYSKTYETFVTEQSDYLTQVFLNNLFIKPDVNMVCLYLCSYN